MAELTPLVLQGAPALIEGVFPAQKVSFEAQRERKANLGQTLTGLGSYWKGRKPLILVRSIVLGCLLPQTNNKEKDLEIFEALMGLDDEGLARRAVIQSAIKPKNFASLITLSNPWDFFSYTIKDSAIQTDEVETWEFPIDADEKGIALRWQRDIKDESKLILYRKVLTNLSYYEDKAALCKRPEEVNQEWLYAPVWSKVNHHYAHFNINANSHQELIEQLGILRYGHRPRVGDTFCGGGSIPFEAARLGCDVYASDLNPIACMLTWGALNIVGSHSEHRSEIKQAQADVAKAVDIEITKLGIEHDELGNRAKSYLYCLETRCPETGWLVPMSPTWVISKRNSVISKLVPDYDHNRFDIEVITGASAEEMKSADKGTVQDGALVYELDGKTHRTPIKTLRGDYRDVEGNTRNRLRLWEIHDFKPRPDDIFQERLYAIHWIKKESLQSSRHETYITAVSEDDLTRERIVEQIIAENLEDWQRKGLVPDMKIDPGNTTNTPIRARGYTYWHHLFNARQLLLYSLYFKYSTPEDYVLNAKTLNWNSRLAIWMNQWEKTSNVFYNQTLNTLYNYGNRCFMSHEAGRSFELVNSPLPKISQRVENHEAGNIAENNDIYVTDPPYADAVHYHEITEYFIAWLRKNPPSPFNEWTWDSRRALAIKGSGDDFRRGMINAYSMMTNNMPDDGLQCVMFTHQNTGVWSDLIGIFWASGLQVVAAWYIATETTSGLKKGGYVQGTVILILRKRASGERAGFKQNILPEVITEVTRQIETMMHLNDEVNDKMSGPVFNDSDLQMAGHAAALKVLTAYTQIGGENVTEFAMRPRRLGEITIVDDIVQQAAEVANSQLIPEGISQDTWLKLNGIQRFYLRMMDMENTGATRLDNYQNFAKAFRVVDYTKVMANMTANKAQLKHVTDFTSRDLTESTELGATLLGQLITGLQQLLDETEPQVVIRQLQDELSDFIEARQLLIDLLGFFVRRAPEDEVRQAAEVLGDRLRNLRTLDQ